MKSLTQKEICQICQIELAMCLTIFSSNNYLINHFLQKAFEIGLLTTESPPHIVEGALSTFGEFRDDCRIPFKETA